MTITQIGQNQQQQRISNITQKVHVNPYGTPGMSLNNAGEKEQATSAQTLARTQDEVIISAEARTTPSTDNGVSGAMKTAENFTPPTDQEFLNGVLQQSKREVDWSEILTFCEPKSTVERPRINGTEFVSSNFTSEELRAAQKFLTGLGEAFYENGVTGGSLDYEDYAALGMGEGYVRAFGKEHGFSDKKISELVEFYQSKTKNIVEQNLERLPLERQVTHLDNSKYFLVFRDEAKTIAGRYFPEGSLASYPDVAVNWELIHSIYDTMASADMNNTASLDSALASFKESAMEARSVHSFGRVDWLNNRVGLYMDKLSNVQSAVNALIEQV